MVGGASSVVMDLSPGDGALALASLDMKVMYSGLAECQSHKQWLLSRCDQTMLSFMKDKEHKQYVSKDVETLVDEAFPAIAVETNMADDDEVASSSDSSES